jgi:hypothetical protein
MPLRKILLKPGVNQENTRYTNEGGWYSCDKVRFRQGTPEKIGGWQQISAYTFQGVCRSLWTWGTITDPSILTGVGTNLKFYIAQGGVYNDVTPIRANSGALSNPFVATSGSTTITVTDNSHGCTTGDFVTFSGALGLSTQTFTRSTSTEFILSTALANNTPITVSVSSGGTLPTGLVAGVVYYIRVVSGTTVNFANVADGAPLPTTTAGSGTFSLQVEQGITADVLNQNFQVTVVNANSYTITSPVAATVYDVGGGGTTVYAVYEIPVEILSGPIAFSGWGAGSWSSGSWGIGATTIVGLRLWYQSNFGEDLIYGYRGGVLYYWNAKLGTYDQTFTVTIASPGVFTYSGASLVNNTAVILQTTGALPTGLTVGVTYYVVGSSGTTFSLAATPGGAAITTTGTQSGTHTISARGIPLSSLAGASDVPTVVNNMTISDVSRFVLAFGCNPIGETALDPMFIRWTDQESAVDWTPSSTNQAGGIRLSHGSEIRGYVQTRQEIVVFTDSSVYSLQYLGPPFVWGAQLLGNNISIAGINTPVLASGVVYWMGVDKFYRYDGRVQTLSCDLRQYVFGDINLEQQDQFFGGTNEGFNEIWWFYSSADSAVIDRYVIYNYLENIWYYGTLGRTAWIDSGLNAYPLAATYEDNLVFHELGVNDNTTGTPAAISSYITSAEFDIDDGHNFGYVWRLLPDMTFRGSTAASPQVTMTLLPLQNSGSGYNNPIAVGGPSDASVVRSAVVPVEKYTGQVLIRVRGRQMSIKIEGNQVGLQWQLGAPRIDIKPDGRR